MASLSHKKKALTLQRVRRFSFVYKGISDDLDIPRVGVKNLTALRPKYISFPFSGSTRFKRPGVFLPHPQNAAGTSALHQIHLHMPVVGGEEPVVSVIVAHIRTSIRRTDPVDRVVGQLKLDAPDDIPADYHGEVFRNIDLVTVSSKAAVRPFCRAMHLTEEQVRPLGVSRTDLYFSEKWRARCASRFRERYPEVYGKIIVLWAPTFRGNAGVPELLDLDVGKLQQELGDSYLVLTRLHPHMKQAQKESAHDCPIPTEELYPVVDVLIADYSSLIYEYLLFGGQVVLYAPDVEEYRKRRGFYMDIDEIPGEIVTDPVSLADAVRQAAEHTRSQKDRPRDLFLMKYMGACDGHVTERIYSWMNGGCQRRTDIFDYK